MAFNVLNIGFDGTVETSVGDRSNFVSEGDNNDIIYYLGTNFGTSAWSNPAGSSITISTTGTVAGGSANVITDNSNTALTGPGSANMSAILHFNNIVFNPVRCDTQFYQSNSGENIAVLNVFLDVSKDGITWVTLSDYGNIGSYQGYQWENLFNSTNIIEVYSYLRVRWRSEGNSNASGLSEVKLYGSFKRTDGGTAGRTSPVTSIQNLADSKVVSNPSSGDLLFTQEGFLKSTRDVPYRTYREILTTNFTIPNSLYLRPNYYIFDPNNVNRTINLPTSPVIGDFIRIRNLNNGFELSIVEDGPNRIATIGGSAGAGLTQGDFWWDGTEWTGVAY